MDYGYIEKNYFIVSTTFRQEKEILVCRKKSDLSFAYFYVDGTEYVAADEKLTQELNKIYFIKPSNVRHLRNKKNDEYPSEKNAKLVQNVKAKLKEFLQANLPYEEFLVCEERLAKLKVVFTSKESDFVGNYYLLSHKIIVLLDECMEETLFHEMLHAVGTKNKKQLGFGFYFEKTGFDIMVKIATSFYGYAANLLGLGLDEAVTEYFAENLSFQTEAYADLPNTFGRLCKFLDQKQVLQFKVKNDLKGFVEYVKNEFHETTNEKVLDLVVKMDAYYALYIDDSEKRNMINQFEMNNLSLSMTKIIVDLIVNKYVKEGIDISELEYSQLFDGTNICLFQNLEEDQNIFDTFELRMNEYIQDKIQQYGQKRSSDIDLQKLANLYLLKGSKSMTRIITNNGFFIPEKYKNATSLMAVVNSLSETSWGFLSINIDKAKSLLVRDFLNPMRGFLPKDLCEREKFYQSLIQIASMLNFNIYKKIPMKNLVNIFNQEPSLIEIAMLSDPNYTISNILPKLDGKVILKNKESLLNAFNNLDKKNILLHQKKLTELFLKHNQNDEIFQEE